MSCPTYRCDGAPDAAGEFGDATRVLAEAIAELPKCVDDFDRQRQLNRIKALRIFRDRAASAYRAWATGGAA